MNHGDLEQLPLETLQQIASHLHDTHRPSLYSFGLASKICYRATVPSIFREIHLTVRHCKALHGDVNALVKALSRTEAARHVRSFSIRGSLLMNVEETGEGKWDDDYRWFKGTGRDEVFGDEEPFVHGWHSDHGPVEVPPEEDMAWAPVVNLVKALPHLTKLLYDCRNQFPPSLLNVLHSHHPHCKLYHLTFRLRSLGWETPDLHEMAIATSPCLYFAKVRCAWRDSNAEDDFNQEAMLELVAGLAPNLKELVMVYVSPTLGSRGRRIPRGPWRGLPGFVSGSATGSLTSLSLVGAEDFSPQFLQNWSKHTSFNSLRHLVLGGGWECPDGINGETMCWIVEHCQLPCLETLYIRLARDDKRVEKPNYVNDTIAFFKAFEPLNELTVSGPLEPDILDAILSTHGCALRKLSLSPSENPFNNNMSVRFTRHIPMVFKKEHIMRIQAECPLLRDLAVPVKRTKSDGLEAEMYRSFGKIEHLRSLCLTLDCSDWRVTRCSTLADDPSFDEDDRRLFNSSNPCLKRGHLRDAFLNCAVDEALARSIWDTICRVKVGRPLESLKLYTTGGGMFGDTASHGDYSDFVEHLSRSWLIERSVRDDDNKAIVKELGQRAREGRDEYLTDLYDWQGDSRFPATSAVHVFRRVWPPKEGSKDWRQDWASLPLQG